MVDERRRLIPRRLDHEDDQEDPPCLCCFTRKDNKTLAKTGVLVSVALERLAFYSVSANLVLFLNGTAPNWSAPDAMNAVFYFLGISCIFYFLGGVIADLKFGRFRIILFSFMIYMIGYAILPAIAAIKGHSGKNSFHCDSFGTNHSCMAFVYVALTIVGAGTGMLRANIAPFGADQVNVASTII